MTAMLVPVWALAQDAGTERAASAERAASMMAESPFTNYTAGVVAYVLATGFLVALLLIGGLLILNLGLLSKRKEDRVGGRTPSDVGILQHNPPWAEPSGKERHLPAEEDDDDLGTPSKAA
jgi:hypothetical protein